MNTMTEAEAEKKWCPFVRTGMYGEGDAAVRMVAVNRDPRYGIAELAPCLGSACMGWRDDPEHLTHQPIGMPESEAVGPRRGYCGFAGKL